MKSFKKTYIEITTACNLACEFCPKTSRPTEFMAPDLFEHILKSIQRHSKYLYFHVMGEPLLHPEIGTFLDRCQDFGFLVNLSTNGTLIHAVGEMILSKPALRQVSFSLHSFSSNNENRSLDEYLDQIFAFVRLSQRENPLFISLKLWNSPSDARSNGSPNRRILQRIEKEFKLGNPLPDLASSTGIKIADNIYLNQAPAFEWPSLNNQDIGDRGFCLGLRDQIAILVDGTIVPCCLDAEGVMSLGNIENQSLSQILAGQRAQTIFKGFSESEARESLCKKCSYRTRFS